MTTMSKGERREDGIEQSEKVDTGDFKTERTENVTDIPSLDQFRVGIVGKLKALVREVRCPNNA